MIAEHPHPVVHLELHTADLSRACAFYTELLAWRTLRVLSYQALEWGDDVGGGVVECGARRPLWIPYVRVDRVAETTARARALGAAVLLRPREGPAGWRSVISSPEAGELAFWQPKERA